MEIFTSTLSRVAADRQKQSERALSQSVLKIRRPIQHVTIWRLRDRHVKDAYVTATVEGVASACRAGRLLPPNRPEVIR